MFCIYLSLFDKGRLNPCPRRAGRGGCEFVLGDPARALHHEMRERRNWLRLWRLPWSYGARSPRYLHQILLLLACHWIWSLGIPKISPPPQRWLICCEAKTDDGNVSPGEPIGQPPIQTVREEQLRAFSQVQQPSKFYFHLSILFQSGGFFFGHGNYVVVEFLRIGGFG